MLVPTKLSGDMLIWHFLYNRDGNRISYLDNTVAHAENVGVSDLDNTRHVVGWCSKVRSYAGRNIDDNKRILFANIHCFTGAAGAEHTIRRSQLPGPHAGYVLEKVSVSSGKFVTGGATFGIGIKDTCLCLTKRLYVEAPVDIQEVRSAVG
jgi:hypothetical protein